MKHLNGADKNKVERGYQWKEVTKEFEREKTQRTEGDLSTEAENMKMRRGEVAHSV